MKKLHTIMAAAAAFAWAGAATAEPVAISTLPPGAINNVQAQVVAKVVQENSDLQMRVSTFNGPSAIIGAAENGQVEFAYTSNDEAGAAVRGTDEHEGRPMENLRVAMTVFPFVVGIMVKDDSDIHSVEDLKGRKMATGWQGFRQGIPLFDAMLATGGLSLAEDADPVPATNLLRAADDFKAGRTDAAMFAIGAPKVAEIDSAIDGVRFLDLPDSPEAEARMQQVRPEYHLYEQEPAPYLPGVKGTTTLMEYYIVVLTNQNVDEDTVYEFVKAVHPNKEALVAGHPSFNRYTADGIAVRHQDMPYHEGAIRYFKEAGLWEE